MKNSNPTCHQLLATHHGAEGSFILPTFSTMSSELQSISDYQNLIDRISETYAAGRHRALQVLNAQLLETYWQIGHDIVQFEQGGKVRADYGTALLHTLSSDLTRRHGKGFSRSNLIYMRLLYLEYPISQKPSDLLSWSHYVELSSKPRASYFFLHTSHF